MTTQDPGRRASEPTNERTSGAPARGQRATAEQGGPAEAATPAADLVAAWEGRDAGWEQLVALATELGRDPSLASLSDRELEAEAGLQASRLAAATCRWLELVAELVVRGVWADQGASSPAQWLAWRVGLAPSTARDHVRVGLQLRRLPALRDRFAGGRISYSKVRALTRVAVPAIEPMLLRWADAAPASEIERLVSSFRSTQRAARIQAGDPDVGRDVVRRSRGDGLAELRVIGTPDEIAEIAELIERLAVLEQAAEVERDDDTQAGGAESDSFEADRTEADRTEADRTEADRTGTGYSSDGPLETSPRPHGAKLVDALHNGLVGAVAAGPVDTSGADRHTLVISADADDLAEPDTAEPMPSRSDLSGVVPADTDLLGADPAPARSAHDTRHDRDRDAEVAGRPAQRLVAVTDGQGQRRTMDRRVLRRLACEAGIVIVIRDRHGTPIDVGRRDRRLSVALRRALVARDRSCRFPGCGATRHLHAHHVRHWADGGPTDLANLVLLCATHHQFVHERDWVVENDGGGRFIFSPPKGDPLAEVVPLVGVPDSAEAGADAPGEHDGLLPKHWPGPGQADLDLIVAVLQQELRRAFPARPVVPAGQLAA